MPQPTAPIAESEAQQTVLALFGLRGRAITLASERDQTFAFTAETGTPYILKISHPAERRETLDFQLGALNWLAARSPALPVPRVIAPAPGRAYAVPSFADGSRRITALLSYLAGEPLHKTAPTGPQAYNLGQSLALLAQALRPYPAPPAPDKLLWDLTHAPAARPLLAGAAGQDKTLAAAALDAFEDEILPIHRALPRQVIHNDFNPHNLLVSPQDPDEITGIIDFGDLVCAPRINDLAIALAYRVVTPQGRASLPSFLRGYNAIAPLSEPEQTILPGLIKTRLAMTLTIAAWRARQTPRNSAYLLRFCPPARACLETLAPLSAAQTRIFLRLPEPEPTR
jgi:Ser/Thr protein kinase RdoA (MazF antagonist)